jgi:hypothetical protein
MKKNYPYPLYVTLQGELIIIRNYMELQPNFSARNPDMTVAYGQEIETRINQAIISFTTDKKQEQKAATRDIKAIIAESKVKLSDLFTDIAVVFRSDKPKVDILKNELGYTRFNRKANENVQEAIIQYLFTFADNLPAYRSELTEKKIPDSRLDEIIKLAQECKNANITQELSKSKSRQLTAEQQAEVNTLYTEVMAICRLGKSIFRQDKEKWQLFNFKSVIEAFGGTRTKKEEEIVPTN